MSRTKNPRFFYGYFIVLAASLVFITVGAAFFGFGVYFEPLLAEFGWSRAAASGAYSAFLLLQGLLGLVMGRLTDKFGPRLVVVIAAVFLTTGYLLMSRLGTMWQFYLSYGLIIGVGMSATWIPLLSTVARWFTKGRGLMTGVTVSIANLSMLVWPPLTSWLISNYDWRTSYVITGAVTFIVVMVAIPFLRRDAGQMGLTPYGEGEETTEASSLGVREISLSNALRTSQLWLLCAIFFGLWLVAFTIPVHFVIYATSLGISLSSAVNVLAVAGASTFGGIVVGFIDDKIGNKKTVVIICILSLVSLVWLLVAKELWMLYLFAVIFGVVFCGAMILQSPMVADLFGLRSHGEIFGVIFLASMVGSAIGPVMAGYIFDVTNSYQLAFLILIALSLISLILALLLKPINLERKIHRFTPIGKE